MKKGPFNIDTIHQCNCCLGNTTWHPLISTIDLSKANRADYAIRFNFYVVLLMENECNSDVRCFTKLFKKITGVTPVGFRL